MKLAVYNLTIVLSAMCLAACQKDIVVDIEPEQPRLAIYSMLQPDSLISVYVSSSKSVTDATPLRAIDDAEVTLTVDGLAPQLLTLVDAEQGHYRADFVPQPGVTYQLSVTAPGYPPAEANTQMPRPVAIRQADYTISLTNQVSDCGDRPQCADTITRYAIAITFQDFPSEQNFYEISGSQEYATEQQVYDSLTDDTSTVQITQRGLIYNRSDDPVLQEEVLINDPRYRWPQEFFFTDELFDGTQYTFDYTAESEAKNPLRMVITLTTWHEDAFRYEQTKHYNQYFDVMLYEPIPLHQNIQGGYGIFSSFSQNTVTIELN